MGRKGGRDRDREKETDGTDRYRHRGECVCGGVKGGGRGGGSNQALSSRPKPGQSVLAQSTQLQVNCRIWDTVDIGTCP